jgi:hypothetical protein
MEKVHENETDSQFFFHFPWCQLLCCRPLLSWCFLSTLAICAFAFSHQKCQASKKMNKLERLQLPKNIDG